MELVEPEDGPPFRRPPSLDDRLWRHPSEVRSPRAPANPRALWTVAVVSAVGASLLTTTLVLTYGQMTAPGRREASLPRTIETVATSIETEPAVGAAERARPAIVQIQVRKPAETTGGSGVLFRPDGHVLTNHHVVEGATSVKVTLADGREVSARLVGSDPETDVAVVKIDGGPFPTVELGSGSSLKVGQVAVAVGSPLALAGGPSVTVGVVSALHRTVRTRSNQVFFDMIQTDAPISPGSSGGALLDRRGSVIGITTAMAVTDTGPEALGFAIPIDLAVSIADQLITTGGATHLWLGIEGNDLDSVTAHDLNLEGGALVSVVRSQSPADRAGLAARDVIVAVSGRPITSMGTLVATIRMMRPGAAVVEVVRDGQRRSMTVILAEKPSNP